MTPPTKCLECGADLSPAETQGLCAPCLLKMGLASQLGGSSMPASPGSSGPPPLMPFNFGSYRIVRLLGKGGMGAVYEAEDRASGRRVALKALGHSLDSPDTRKRFLREGRIAASINHPNTVYVFGTEEIDGAPVITMEMVHGGTLHERVKERGPMPITEAVDAILQVIAGLEAAASVGILHRDVKPANCFIDPAGTVKVGDFGLSISTTTRGDSALTIAGSVLGTPEFSSPEQLRGEELNIRSDIYSVGVTLYYLLTGKTPFHAENVVQLLATVLDKTAPSPRSVRPEIPEPLARIVMRCLAKQAGDRFANYDELRRALLPFNSTSPTPATLGLRFVAGAVDRLALTVAGFAIPLLFYSNWTVAAGAATQYAPRMIWMTVAMLAVRIVYFAIPEGLWGASLGKAIVGLRVAGLDRCAPGIPRALWRAIVFSLPMLVSFVPRPDGLTILQMNLWTLGSGVVMLGLWALLFGTARRRNGFAALHDLASHTRVIQKSAYEPRPSVAPSEEPVAAIDALPQLGPFHVLGPLAAGENETLILAYDTKLLRRVWIRKAPAGEPPLPAPLRNAARPGRLRWLQGTRSDPESWDAYEAVPGSPLVSLLGAPQPWKVVRFWLLDLAEELEAASRDGSLPETLALDRIWIQANGRAKLLDFSAPGAAPQAGIESIASDAPGAAQHFLDQLAVSALEGRAVSANKAGTRCAAVPVPLGARSFLQHLREMDLGSIGVQLREFAQQVPRISRLRRLGLTLGCVLPALLVGAMMLFGAAMSVKLREMYPDIQPLLVMLKMSEAYDRPPPAASDVKIIRVLKMPPKTIERTNPAGPHDPAPMTQKEAIPIYIAGRFGSTVRDPATWSSAYAKMTIDQPLRARAEKIVAAHPHPTAGEMQEATRALAIYLDKNGNVSRTWSNRDMAKTLHWNTPRAVSEIIGCGAILTLLCAVAFRGGLLLRVLGIAVVTDDGRDASRWRMLWRTFIAFSPFIAGVFIAATTYTFTDGVPSLYTAVLIGCGLAVWSLLLPERSLQDRLAGTWLVPR